MVSVSIILRAGIRWNRRDSKDKRQKSFPPFGLSASIKRRRWFNEKRVSREWNQFLLLCKYNVQKRRIIAKQGKSSRLRVVQQKAKKRLQLRILLKVFAFLLCFVLYVYVMIFQFEIKHKVLCNGIHLPVGSESHWRSCLSQPTPSTTLHTGTLFKSIKPIAFTPFFADIKFRMH